MAGNSSRSLLFPLALAGLVVLILGIKHVFIVEFLKGQLIAGAGAVLVFVLGGACLSRVLRSNRLPRRAAWAGCTVVLLAHLYLSPFAYELEEVLEGVEVPPGGELVEAGSQTYAVTVATSAWREYRYPNGTEVNAIVDGIARSLEAQGLVVEASYQEENVNGPLGSVTGERGSIRILAFVCGCRVGHPPDGAVYLRLTAV